jgi:alpha-ribazole phosphatase
MRLLLAPHAPTDWNAVGRYQGHSDTALSDIGRQQAALLAARLDDERIDEVHASDLRRAQETASFVYVSRSIPCRTDPRLRELHFGAWEGMSHDEVQHRYADALIAWQADPLRTPPPGGETLAQLADRIGGFLSDVGGERNDQRTMLVVAHRGSLRVLVCLALGLPPTARWQFRLESASLSELNLYSEGALLNYLNDTHHLKEAAHAC